MDNDFGFPHDQNGLNRSDLPRCVSCPRSGSSDMRYKSSPNESTYPDCSTTVFSGWLTTYTARPWLLLYLAIPALPNQPFSGVSPTQLLTLPANKYHFIGSFKSILKGLQFELLTSMIGHVLVKRCCGSLRAQQIKDRAQQMASAHCGSYVSPKWFLKIVLGHFIPYGFSRKVNILKFY